MVSLQDLNEGMTDCESVRIVCPICRGELAFENSYRRHGHVRTGQICCLKDCAVFPIIYGVPVLLSPGRPAAWDEFYNWPWNPSMRMSKKQLMESVVAGAFDKETEISGPPVSKRKLRKIRRILKQIKPVSNKHSVIGERLRRVESGVVVDVGCGGGYTTERVLHIIQPSVYSVFADIDFASVKVTEKRAELAGSSNRSIGICADARHLPFSDESLSAAYTLYGFDYIRYSMVALKEVYRALKCEGALVVRYAKSSMWHEVLDSFGLNYDERLEVLSRLGWCVNGQEFVENVRKVGFDILSIDDLESNLLVNAVKR